MSVELAFEAPAFVKRRLPKRLLLARAIRAAGHTPGHQLLAEAAELGVFSYYENASRCDNPQEKLVKSLRLLGEDMLAYQVMGGQFSDELEDGLIWLAGFFQPYDALLEIADAETEQDEEPDETRSSSGSNNDDGRVFFDAGQRWAIMCGGVDRHRPDDAIRWPATRSCKGSAHTPAPSRRRQ